MKIGILSDTHSTFDDPLRRFFSDVDQIWHAGDIGSIELFDQIAAFKPLRAVYGNIDDHRVRMVCREFDFFKCEQVTVLITHIANSPRARLKLQESRPTIYVTGHSHILKVHNQNGVLCINPGAAGHGYQGVRTAIRLEIEGKRVHSLEVLEI